MGTHAAKNKMQAGLFWLKAGKTIPACAFAPSLLAGINAACDWETHPLPSNGIFVALIVIVNTFDSSGRLAIIAIACPT